MPDTPQSLALDRYIAFQNSGGDAWGDQERRARQAAEAQAEVDARKDWIPFSGFDPFTNSWEAKFVPADYALEAENFNLQMAHPGARLVEDPFSTGLAYGRRAITQNQYEDNRLAREKFEQQKKEQGMMTPYQQARIDALLRKPVSVPQSAADKSQQGLLEARINDNRRAILAKPLRNDRKILEQAIEDDEVLLQELLSKTAAAPSAWGVDPNSIPAGAPMDVQYPKSRAEAEALSMFGQPGGRTPFAFSGGSAPPPVPQPIRRRRWNPATGRFE